MNDIVNFDFTLNINQNEINESFRGILLVYNTKDELLGYIAGNEYGYLFMDSFDIDTEKDYENIVDLLVGVGIDKGYIKLLKFK